MHKPFLEKPFGGTPPSQTTGSIVLTVNSSAHNSKCPSHCLASPVSIDASLFPIVLFGTTTSALLIFPFWNNYPERQYLSFFYQKRR